MAKAKARTLREMFGRRLRELRKHRACPWRRSGAVRHRRQYIQRVETAQKAATLDTIEKIAAGLGLHAADLFTVGEEGAASARKRAAKLIGAVSDEDVRRIVRVLEALTG